MASTYSWSTVTNYSSDTDLSYGVIPNDPSWHDTDAISGSATATYYYRDANVSTGGVYTDANSSRVAVVVTNSWIASISGANVVTVTLTTTIDSIIRDDLRGSNQNTPGRIINIYDSAGTRVFGPYTDTNLTSAHTISGPINVGTLTFVLQPGMSAEKSALQLHNQTVGSASYDDIGIGVRFKNSLPADYRPGGIYVQGSGWLSHNRSGGADDVYNGSSWNTMRTLGAPTAQGNPPELYHNGDWFNMRKIDQE